MRDQRHVVLLPFLLGLLAAPAAAQLVDSPRAMGMGGAVRGDPVANSALIHNPAGMARAMVYAAQAQYFRSGPSDANAVAVNVVDSKTQPNLAMGVAYGYQFTDSGAPMEASGHDARLGMATPLIPQQLSLGVSLHYMYLERDKADDLKRFTADVGLLWSPSQVLHVGLVGQNLIKTDDPAAPRKLGGGLAFTSGPLSIDVDVMADLDTAEETKPVVHAGLEVLLGEVVPLRGGVVYDKARDRTLATGGLGVMGGGGGGPSAFQLNLAYQQDVDDSDFYLLSAGAVFFL